MGTWSSRNTPQRMLQTSVTLWSCCHMKISLQLGFGRVLLSIRESTALTFVVTKNPTSGTSWRFWEASHSGSISPVLLQDPFPWITEDTALRSAHFKNNQELKNSSWSLGPAVLLGHQQCHWLLWDFTVFLKEGTPFPIFWPTRPSRPTVEICLVQFLHKEIYKLCPTTASFVCRSGFCN